MVSFQNENVENVFLSYEEPYKSTLLEVRELIFQTASKIEGVGQLTESLKWGEPTYSTLETKSGTPIRINKFDDNHIAVFFHCQTNLIEQFRGIFSEELKFSKNRAILLNPNEILPLNELEFCIAAALVYHKDSINRNGL